MAIDPVTGAAIIGAGANLLGGIMGGNAARRERNNQKRDYRTSFRRMREAAELGGFNPLEVLRSTGGGGSVPASGGAPPLASIQMISDAVKDVGRIASGQTAQENKQNELKAEVLQREVERLSNVGTQTALRTRNSYGPSGGMPQRYTPLPQLPAPQPKRKHIHEKITTSSGNELSVPVGPDMDEIVTGYMINRAGDIQTIRDSFKERPMHTVGVMAKQFNPMRPYRAIRDGFVQPLLDDISDGQEWTFGPMEGEDVPPTPAPLTPAYRRPLRGLGF